MTKKNKFNIFDYFGEVTYSFYTLKDSTTDYYGEVRFHFYNAECILVTEFTNKNQIDEIIEFEEKRIKGFESRGFPLVFDDAHTQRRIWNPKRHISILKEPKVEYLKKAVESGRQLKSTKTTSRPVSQLESDEWDQIVAELIKKPDEEKVEYLKKAVESGRKLKVHRSLSGKDRCNKKIDEDEAQLEEIWGLDEEINKEIDEAEFNSWLKENQIESYFKWLKERNKN